MQCCAAPAARLAPARGELPVHHHEYGRHMGVSVRRLFPGMNVMSQGGRPCWSDAFRLAQTIARLDLRYPRSFAAADETWGDRRRGRVFSMDCGGTARALMAGLKNS